MKVETSELEGVVLDWAVAEAMDDYCVRRASDVGHAWFESDSLIVVPSDHNQWSWPLDEDGWSPSTLWQQGGPLMSRLASLTQDYSGKWYAIPKTEYDVIELSGQTMLIAAMRAIVAAKLGDEVDVPDELIN